MRHEVSNNVSVDGRTIIVYDDVVDDGVFSNEVPQTGVLSWGILNRNDAYILQWEMKKNRARNQPSCNVDRMYSKLV